MKFQKFHRKFSLKLSSWLHCNSQQWRIYIVKYRILWNFPNMHEIKKILAVGSAPGDPSASATDTSAWIMPVWLLVTWTYQVVGWNLPLRIITFLVLLSPLMKVYFHLILTLKVKSLSIRHGSLEKKWHPFSFHKDWNLRRILPPFTFCVCYKLWALITTFPSWFLACKDTFRQLFLLE